MSFTPRSVWSWMTLCVRNPRMGFQLVKDAQLPIEASLMIIALAAILFAGLMGVALLNVQESAQSNPLMYIKDGVIFLVVSETEAIAAPLLGPIAFGLQLVVQGIGLALSLFYVGRRMGGSGTFPEMLSLAAVLELVVSVLFVASILLSLLLPFVALVGFFLMVFVLVRGLVHASNVGHSFEDISKSGFAALGAIVMLFVLLILISPLLSVLGLSASGERMPIPTEILNEL